MDIKEIKKLLKQYSKFLEKYGYTDSDWREEKPTAIGRFLSEDNKSFPLDKPVKPACINCKFYKEFNKQDYNEHSYIIQWCNLHNYGLSMWKCDKVGCTEFESKSV